MFFLKNLWAKKRGLFPGKISDFINFLGAESIQQVEKMKCEELMNLPVVKSHQLTVLDEKTGNDGQLFSWCWQCLICGGVVCMEGVGTSYQEAALCGLVVYWSFYVIRHQVSNN